MVEAITTTVEDLLFLPNPNCLSAAEEAGATALRRGSTLSTHSGRGILCLSQCTHSRIESGTIYINNAATTLTMLTHYYLTTAEYTLMPSIYIHEIDFDSISARSR